MLEYLPAAHKSHVVEAVAFINAPLGHPMHCAKPPSLVL
jgi:hypothetical protein